MKVFNGPYCTTCLEVFSNSSIVALDNKCPKCLTETLDLHYSNINHPTELAKNNFIMSKVQKKYLGNGVSVVHMPVADFKKGKFD